MTFSANPLRQYSKSRTRETVEIEIRETVSLASFVSSVHYFKLVAQQPYHVKHMKQVRQMMRSALSLHG